MTKININSHFIAFCYITGPEIDEDDFENEFPSSFPDYGGIDDGFLDIPPKKNNPPAENPNGLILGEEEVSLQIFPMHQNLPQEPQITQTHE